MKVQQIRDGIKIARRTFTPDVAHLNVNYPESATLALQAATHRKLRPAKVQHFERKRGPRLRERPWHREVRNRQLGIKAFGDHVCRPYNVEIRP